MNRNGSKKRVRKVRIWGHEQARKAAPYIAGILGSLREQRLEALGHSRRAARLAARPGRPGRELLVAQAEAVRQAREAEDRFRDSLAELNALDIFCPDPLRGEGYIPFLHADKLAWYIFDLFDGDEHLRQWRYHDDPVEMRRPIAEAIPVPDPAELAWSV
jgi:hypothetical protein